MKPIILYDNRFLDAVPVADDTATGYDIVSIRDLRTFKSWKAANTTTPKYFKVNCGSAKTADTVAILSHNLGTISADFTIQYSTDDTNWSDAFSAIDPANDLAIMKLFTSQSKQYWRGKINGTISDKPFMGEVLLGARLEFPKFPSGKGSFSPVEEEPKRESNISSGGNLLGVVTKYKELDMSVEFRNIDPAWVIQNFEPFWDNYACDGKPFVYAWNLDLDPTGIYWAWFSEKYKYRRFISGDPGQTLSLEMKGIKI